MSMRRANRTNASASRIAALNCEAARPTST
jgi:hypothetical protein